MNYPHLKREPTLLPRSRFESFGAAPIAVDDLIYGRIDFISHYLPRLCATTLSPRPTDKC